jgi:hypothetical protein
MLMRRAGKKNYTTTVAAVLFPFRIVGSHLLLRLASKKYYFGSLRVKDAIGHVASKYAGVGGFLLVFVYMLESASFF